MQHQQVADLPTLLTSLKSGRDVVQLYRIPGLTHTAAASLLKKVTFAWQGSPCWMVSFKAAADNMLSLCSPNDILASWYQVQKTVSGSVSSIDTELVSALVLSILTTYTTGTSSLECRNDIDLCKCLCQCYNIALSASLSEQEAETLAW